MAGCNFFCHAIENSSQVINFITEHHSANLHPGFHITTSNSCCHLRKFNNWCSEKLKPNKDTKSVYQMTNAIVLLNKKHYFVNCYNSRCRIGRCCKDQSQNADRFKYLQLQMHTSHSPKVKLLVSPYYTIYCK